MHLVFRVQSRPTDILLIRSLIEVLDNDRIIWEGQSTFRSKFESGSKIGMDVCIRGVHFK